MEMNILNLEQSQAKCWGCFFVLEDKYEVKLP